MKSKSVKISAEASAQYEKRRLEYEQDPTNDPEIPMLPIKKWENASIGKYYRPLKTQISFRIDNDVLDWLKSQGEGHLTRINAILRERMEQGR